MSNRREFITLLGGAAAWPMAARAQQPSVRRRPLLGYLITGSREGMAYLSTPLPEPAARDWLYRRA
jgi:hypothetical protein